MQMWLWGGVGPGHCHPYTPPIEKIPELRKLPGTGGTAQLPRASVRTFCWTRPCKRDMPLDCGGARAGAGLWGLPSPLATWESNWLHFNWP